MPPPRLPLLHDGFAQSAAAASRQCRMILPQKREGRDWDNASCYLSWVMKKAPSVLFSALMTNNQFSRCGRIYASVNGAEKIVATDPSFILHVLDISYFRMTKLPL
jgi:hypothetical protein